MCASTSLRQNYATQTFTNHRVWLVDEEPLPRTDLWLVSPWHHKYCLTRVEGKAGGPEMRALSVTWRSLKGRDICFTCSKKIQVILQFFSLGQWTYFMWTRQGRSTQSSLGYWGHIQPHWIRQERGRVREEAHRVFWATEFTSLDQARRKYTEQSGPLRSPTTSLNQTKKKGEVSSCINV